MINHPKDKDQPTIRAKKYLDALTNNQAIYTELDNFEFPLTAVYQKGRSAVVSIGDEEHTIGVIGEFNIKARRTLKLPEYCAGFELDVDLLRSKLQPPKYRPLSEFPETTQDITFELPSEVAWGKLHEFVKAELAVASAENSYNFELEPLGIYQEEDSDKKRVSFRVTLTHHTKTLKTEEVNKLLDQLAKVVHEEFGTTRI